MSKTMTKRKIANEVAERIGITQSAAFEAVKAMLSTISDTLAAGGHIELRGFGIFEIVTQRQRVGRNPNNPQVPVKIPARKVVKFRAGTELAESVRKLKVGPQD
ncbi:MAG: HU family DNA-binding protein [Oligosphaeraceae bacterium]